MSVLSLMVVSQLAATPITLEEVREASRQSLDAIRARLDVQRAESQVKTARSAILPQVSMNFGIGLSFIGPQRQLISYKDPDSGNFVQQFQDTNNSLVRGNFQLGLQVNQLLYDGARWWTQMARSGDQEEAARGQLAEQQLSSELEATRRFFELLKAQLALKVLEESVKRSAEQVARAKALYEAGRGQRSAVYDASTNLGNDEIGVVRQRQRIVQTRLALLQWLGREDADVEAVPPGDLAEVRAPYEPGHAVAQARSLRPLFKSLGAQVRAAELGITVARADYFPRIVASASYSRNSPTADPFFTDPTRQNNLSAGVNLSWDLFNGFAHVANEDRARIELTQAQAQQRQSVLDLESEIRRAVDAHKTEVEVLAISERNLAQAQEQASLETERFSAGAGSSLEVRNAQIKYTQAQLSVLQGRADVATAKAALERAVGGSP
ncbi:MAG: TolC family protein [Archangium sp.]|nr:TolC family protein [Archangium sp.]